LSILPRFDVPARRENRHCPEPGNGLVKAFRLIVAVADGARDSLAICTLIEQARQCQRVAGCVIGYFDSLDFRRGRIDAKMDVAPPATIVRVVLFRLPFAFGEHLDTVLSTSRCRSVVVGRALIVTAGC
jgi:hypothetical protein